MSTFNDVEEIVDDLSSNVGSARRVWGACKNLSLDVRMHINGFNRIELEYGFYYITFYEGNMASVSGYGEVYDEFQINSVEDAKRLAAYVQAMGW